MSNNPDRIPELFDHAAGLPASERAAYLDEACGDDTALRRKIESLLANMASDAAMQTKPSGSGEGTIAGEYAAGDTVGPFTIRECIGTGGMGSVYLAQQSTPVRRQVALKVILAGLDTRNTLARFQVERQALSMMDHPGIARVLEAGATDTGRPWFAMEYIKGIDLNAYCERNRLDITQRLELFTQVCDAVQHAHQKGVIHRDLKPSNILVARDEQDQPQAKIIDFGIAKAVAAPLTEMTLHTSMGQVIGTLSYMSPEQVDGSVDVDTRTDVYSLGVILYELLAGSVPFDDHGDGDYESLKQSIREDDPPKPSTKLTSLTGEEAIRLAKAHRTDLVNLGKKLRMELEWIPLKALRKDRAERYSSPEALGEDVQRYLDGEPLIAGPLTRRYRMRKFIRRHRGGVLTAACVALLLIAATVASLTLWFEADAAKVEAERGRAQALQAETKAMKSAQRETKAKIEAMESEQQAKEMWEYAEEQVEEMVALREFIVNIFLETANASLENPDSNQQQELAGRAMEHMLAIAREKAAVDFSDSPGNRAHIHNAMGAMFVAIRKYEDARDEFEQALAIRRDELGEPYSEDTIKVVQNIGLLLAHQEKNEEAEGYILLWLGECRDELGSDHRDTLRLVMFMGRLHYRQGDHDEARAYFREAFDTFKWTHGDTHPDTISAKRSLGHVLQSMGNYGQARSILEEVLEVEKLEPGIDAPVTQQTIRRLSLLSRKLGDTDASEKYDKLLPPDKLLPTYRSIWWEKKELEYESKSNTRTRTLP